MGNKVERATNLKGRSELCEPRKRRDAPNSILLSGQVMRRYSNYQFVSLARTDAELSLTRSGHGIHLKSEEVDLSLERSSKMHSDMQRGEP